MKLQQESSVNSEMGATDLFSCITVVQTRSGWIANNALIQQQLQCIDVIKLQGEPNHIYFLFPLLQHRDVNIRNKTVEAINFLFSKIPNRTQTSLRNLPVDVSDVVFYKNNFDTGNYVVILIILSNHNSGYVREAVVRELGRLNTTASARFIIYRLADWVIQVRNAANEAMDSLLRTSDPKELIDLLPEIVWLAKVERVDLTGIQSRIIRILTDAHEEASFRHTIRQLPEKTRLLFYRILLQHIPGNETVFTEMIEDESHLVQVLLLTNIDKLSPEVQVKLLLERLDHRFAPVKKAALQKSKPYLETLKDKIELLISDLSGPVRDLSRRMLKLDNEDSAVIYRERIKQEFLIAGSLMGLAETGMSNDLKLFKAYLSSANTDELLGALQGLKRFEPKSSASLALHYLSDQRAKIRKWSVVTLATHRNNEVVDELQSLFHTQEFQVKKLVLKIYHQIGGWKVLPELLTALTDKSTALQEIAWTYLSIWVRKSTTIFTNLPPVTRERSISRLLILDKDETTADPEKKELLKQLRFLLQT